MNSIVWVRATALIAIIIICAPLDSIPKPGAARWEIIGPGGGGALFAPAVSSRDPDRALIASDMTGAYITEDGGRSWRMFNLRGTIHSFAFDAVSNNVMYAMSSELWRSADVGQT